MFCLDDNTSVELLGVFKLKRGSYRHSSTPKRYYDGMCMRLCGSATFRQGNRTCRYNREICYIVRSTHNTPNQPTVKPLSCYISSVIRPTRIPICKKLHLKTVLKLSG